MDHDIRHANWLENDRVFNLTIAAILAPALLIRLVGLNKGIWIDEYHTLMFPVRDGVVQTIRDLRNNDWPPLYFLLIDIWSQISPSEAFLRLLSVLFAIGTIFVVMQWLKQYSRLASILAGVYLATTPSMLRYSQEIRGYSLLVFATGLAFYFASRVIAEPERLSGYVGIAFSLIVAVSTHMVGVMLIAPLVVFVTLNGDRRRIHWVRITTATALPVAVFGFFYFVYLQNVNKTETWWIQAIDWKRVLAVAAKSLTGYSVWKYMPQFTLPLVSFLLLALTVTIFALGKWRASFPFLMAGLVYWLEVILYSVFFTPILVSRTMLPSIVPLSGFLALQIATIQNKRVKTAVIAICTAFSLMVSTTWLMKVAGTPEEPFQQTSQIVRSQWRPHDVIVFFGSHLVEGTVRYYFSDLPAAASISVASTHAKFEQLGAVIEQKLAAQSAGRNSAAIFVIARIDSGNDAGNGYAGSEYQRQKRESYDKLMVLLESKYGPPVSSQAYGIRLVVTKYDASAGT